MNRPQTIETTQPAIGFSAEIFQSYLQGLKVYWKDRVYCDVVKAAERHQTNGPVGIECALRDDPNYQLYGWLEHNLQRFKYVSRYGMLPVMEGQQQELSRRLDEAAQRFPERLVLDPNLRLPEYYREADFHQHPGGIWSDDADAFAYEWGANAFSFAMVAADRPYIWLADYIVSRFDPGSVVDLGCGFGKLVIPLKRRKPSMSVLGVDLAAPLLRLAHMRSLEAGLDINYRQADAENTGLPAASVDAVLCYWLLHELPAENIRGVFREARRLVRPGGVFASFDMHRVPGGTIGEFLHIGHAARNNEPFLPGLIQMDHKAELEKAGFVDVEVVNALDGTPGVDSSSPLKPFRHHAFTVVIGRAPD